MTPEEATERALDLMLPGLSEFDKIALAELMRQTEGIDYPNVKPEQEQALMEMGAIVCEKLGLR